MHRQRRRRAGGVALALVVFLAACSPVAPAPSPPPTTAPAVATADSIQPSADGPLLFRDSITLRKVAAINSGAIRLRHNPADGQLYLLNPVSGLYRLDPTGSGPPVLVAAPASMASGATPAGMAFAADGTLYLVANRRLGKETQAVIRRGVPNATGFAWETLATSAPYPTSGTPFDHLFNGVVVSPDGSTIYVNSGSRTDHGEVQTHGGAFPDAREEALTATVFMLPAGATDLELPNDRAALETAGYIFAAGLRNAYDLAFAPNGDLFAVDNGPDADYPDELNWLRPGHHYGFPWRFSTFDNPVRRPDYAPADDPLLHPDFVAVNTGLYQADPDFPPPPGPFTDPVRSRGPAAVIFRDADGNEQDAAAHDGLSTFTPHRSPLGLVFANDPALPADLRSDDTTLSAFVLSWGAAGGTLSDKGQDLLHLQLSKRGDIYEATMHQLAADFANPIDATLIGDRLYVLEFGAGAAIWELQLNANE
jgi:glucose/arabinose dehydrogenase